MDLDLTDKREREGHASNRGPLSDLGSIRWVRSVKNKVNFGACRAEAITLSLTAFGTAMAGQLLALEKLAKLVGPAPSERSKFAQALDLSEFAELGGIELLNGIYSARKQMLGSSDHNHGNVLTEEDYSKVLQFGIHVTTGETDPSILAKREIELHGNFQQLWGRAELRRLNVDIFEAT